MWECQWKHHLKEKDVIKSSVRSSFPHQASTDFPKITVKHTQWWDVCYAQYDIRAPDNLNEKFEAFPPIFKNTLFLRSDTGEFMKKYAEENKLLTQPPKKRISSLQFINETIITPILYFYLHLELECTQIQRFVHYTPLECFNSFVQSAVKARREGVWNPHSTVIAETMNLRANSSYGYQIMDRSRHILTKHLIDEKAHSAIIKKFLRRLNYVNNNLYAVDSVKSEVDKTKLQHNKLRTLQFFYNLFQNFCDFSSFEEMEMDTDSAYLALAHNSLQECIQKTWKKLETLSKNLLQQRILG